MNLLLVFGPTAHVLTSFIPDGEYDEVILISRNAFSYSNFLCINVDDFDLLSPCDTFSRIFNILSQRPEVSSISILFASHLIEPVTLDSEPVTINNYLSANISTPLIFLSNLIDLYPDSLISFVYISSIYAHITSRPHFYPSLSDRNPLYYGATKAAVEQGLKWLTTLSPRYFFNSIALGPLPSANARHKFPELMHNLIAEMPSQEFVNPLQLHSMINFLLLAGDHGLKGQTIFLDGGMTLW